MRVRIAVPKNQLIFFPALEQRPHLLLLVSDPPRTEVHSLCQCLTSRPQALELVVEHDLRSQDLRFRSGPSCRSGSRSHRFSHRVCRHSMVQSPGNHAKLEGKIIFLIVLKSRIFNLALFSRGLDLVI